MTREMGGKGVSASTMAGMQPAQESPAIRTVKVDMIQKVVVGVGSVEGGDLSHKRE